MNDETTRSETKRKPFPALRYHKHSRRFFFDWEGRSNYWPTGTTRAVAQADYDAMLVAYEAGLPVRFAAAERQPVRTVDALIDGYLAHCDRYYANSKATVANIERALTPLHERFGRRPLDTFGPRLLREVREGMLATGWSRKVINARVQCIVRMFKWAVAEELVPSSVHEALRAVEGLRMGRSSAPEGPGRRPVPWEHVEPVLTHVSQEVAAMLVVQAESGARPGEVVQMRLADLDRSGKVWAFKPQRHKTQHLGKTRLIPLFPAAQKALQPLLCRVPPLAPEEPVFSPRRAEEARSVARRRQRETRVQPSQAERVKRTLEDRRRPPRQVYDVNSYARAVRRGIDAANAATIREAIAGAFLPAFPEPLRMQAARRLAKLAGWVIGLVSETVAVRERAELRLRRALERLAAHTGRRRVSIAVSELLAAAGRAVAGLRQRLLPYWSPYQLRHRFATEGERRFGETAVSLAMGHASLRMTEHYIERNLKAVFERMAEQG